MSFSPADSRALLGWTAGGRLSPHDHGPTTNDRRPAAVCAKIGTSLMSDRTFTLDEAQSLLPVLESLLRTAMTGKKLMEEVDAEMQEVGHRIFLNGGTHLNIVPLARRKAERVKAEQRVRDAFAEIDSIGVQVKDLDTGLLDFPCEVEGRTVLLCWKLGEQG